MARNPKERNNASKPRQPGRGTSSSRQQEPSNKKQQSTKKASQGHGAQKNQSSGNRKTGVPAEQGRRQKQVYEDGYSSRYLEQKRIAESKRKKANRNKRKKPPLSPRARNIRKAIVFVSVLVVVLATGIALSLTVFFNCKNIEVEGTERYTYDEVLSAGTLTTGENLFLSDKATSAAHIKDKLPYVANVEIKIKVPDTLVVEITEAVPEYVIPIGNENLVISEEERIIEKIGDNIYNVPAIKGGEIVSETVGDYVEYKSKSTGTILEIVSESIAKNELAGIKYIDVSNTVNIKLNYSDRLLIELGTSENIDYKIRTAITAIGRLDASATGELNVSLCDGKSKSSWFKNYATRDEELFDDESTEKPTSTNAQSDDTQASSENSTGETQTSSEGNTDVTSN